MARGELIRPVRGDGRGRRRAAGLAAISGALLLVLVAAAMLVGQQTHRAELGAVHEAQAAANLAEGDVAIFLKAMKAQKTVPKQSDAHALDWNWAPELRRDKSVRNWVGSSWVKPLAGDREIQKISPPNFGSGKDLLAAAAGSVGRASKATDTSPRALRLPQIQPLHYFASAASALGTVGTDWSTRDAIKEARHSVDYVQEAVNTRRARTVQPAPAPPAARGHQEVAHPHKDAPRAHEAEAHKTAAVHKADPKTVEPPKSTAKSDTVPATVLAKEQHLRAQIASLRNAIAKEKSA